VRIGTETTPTSNVVVEHLRYAGNNAKIGGGSIMGFNARLDAPEARLLISENVTIGNSCTLEALGLHKARHPRRGAENGD
jgi:hypothetical protein